MGHGFEYEKIWEIVRVNPKCLKTPTSSEVQSKRSLNSSLFEVFDARTNIDIDINADADDIPDDVKEISPIRLVGRDTVNRAQRNERKVRSTQFNRKRKS